jgi:hypothetical protein
VWDTFQKQKNVEPHIYHLQNDYDGTPYYVYSNFRNDYRFIKYLFEFTHKHPGSLIIIGNENQVRFDDGIAFPDESRTTPYFFFARPDSCNLNYTGIRVSFDIGETNFFIEKNVQRKKLYADFDSLNLNIVQDMLDFAEADSAKSDTDNYLYELYNRDNLKKVVIEYHEKGKWFEIEIL